MDCFFFFFKQKTAYEMRISDWSSDVCSSDLLLAVLFGKDVVVEGLGHGERGKQAEGADIEPLGIEALARLVEDRDRRGALLRLHGHCNRHAQACCPRSDEHTSELQSLTRISYAVFCFTKYTTFSFNF